MPRQRRLMVSDCHGACSNSSTTVSPPCPVGQIMITLNLITFVTCLPHKNIKNMCFKGGRLAHELRTCVNMPTTPFLNPEIVIHVAVGQVLRRKLSDDHHSTLRDSYHQGIMEEANSCISPGQICNSLGVARDEFRNCIQMVVFLKNVCFGRQFLCEKGVPHQHHQNVKASQILSDTQY